MKKLISAIAATFITSPAVTIPTVVATAIAITTVTAPPAQAANLFDYLPIPTGAYLNINGAEYFYGVLNDRSQIFPGVAWQIQGVSGILLKGFGYTPQHIINFVTSQF
jgi:hypothetical protein